jgi:hypothetical protein
MGIMDIFQKVAEHVGNGKFELDHPAPIMRAMTYMTNCWNEYCRKSLDAKAGEGK